MTMTEADARVTFDGHPLQSRVLTPTAIRFIAELHHRFAGRRDDLLELGRQRQLRFDAGDLPAFLPETGAVRSRRWRVAPPPAPLARRRVEITGPAERMAMITALGSGADVFVADLEDATVPTWANVIAAQVNLQDAVRGTLRLITPERTYRLGAHSATLMVRPRGWHLDERHLRVAGRPVVASLFDAGLYAFHNASEAVARGFAPYFCLAKLDGHLEARLWRDVICFVEDALGLVRGTIRVTLAVETITGAFEMDEMLDELREHACGLQMARADYLFSIAKTLRLHHDRLLSDHDAVTPDTAFMAAYADLLVATCHRRGAHAIGATTPFAPSLGRSEVSEQAREAVAEETRREALAGYDGSSVAHPDLVAPARAAVDAVHDGILREPERADRPEIDIAHPEQELARRLLPMSCPDGAVSAGGVRRNVAVALGYLTAWLGGTGAIVIDDVLVDVGTAELCRARLWQWIRHHVVLDDGRTVTAELVAAVIEDEMRRAAAGSRARDRHGARAGRLLADLVLGAEFHEFLTLRACELI